MGGTTILIKTEQGWPGHYCLADECLFRRNTLLQFLDTRIIVSTVGARSDGKEIGYNRYYETMVFYADIVGFADVTRQIPVDSLAGISELDAYGQANDMHEDVVKEMSLKLQKGKIV